METKTVFVKGNLPAILVIVFISLVNFGGAQTWMPLVKATQGLNSSQLIQYDLSSQFGSIHRLGIGEEFNSTTQEMPSASFHVKRNFYKELGCPIIRFEAKDTGSVDFFYRGPSPNYTKYAIYQRQSPDVDDFNLFNYIESPIVSPLRLSGLETSFVVIGNDGFPFVSQASPRGSVFTPMQMFHWGIQVTDTLSCNNFKLLNLAGAGKILVSNRYGVGVWMDPSRIGGNWLINYYGDMYSNTANTPNYQHVGIGFQSTLEKIYERLHVLDGNILLSPLHGTNPISPNGSILFGERVTDETTHGKWGIEYYSGGLNFWTVPRDGIREDVDNYTLFLKDDHSVGIGTADTKGYKLAVAGKVICEELKVKLYDNWPDFVFNKDYKLKTISELEEYINVNKHLPDIPLEEEVKSNGVELGKMNSILLQKIEELTRYIINQQKEIDQLKSLIDLH